jgi:hypothetical protein
MQVFPAGVNAIGIGAAVAFFAFLIWAGLLFIPFFKRARQPI